MTEEKISKHTDDDILRAAYALNMCTVSVSQIVDYNDLYIMEQEYDAILNNLNLEKMPKDEALLTTLVELLNTITFFKIQDLRRKMIEKEYQHRMKNAIWSAIPSLSVIAVPLEPATLAISLATQIGTGYMNYRKEKADAKLDRAKAELELQITALEQFNALKRELFTTAWRLAEEYNFPDQYRLTEKQIHQYNEILMDKDELRKYERLAVISDKFEAYPPFWYFFGHCANLLSCSTDLGLNETAKAQFRTKAKEHFQKYEALDRFNILREDQMAAAFALEYIDLLLLEPKPSKKKINELLDHAVAMAGNANDVLQLCAVTYLKLGNAEKAISLFRYLVNEDYNTAANAKLLSRLYVGEFLQNGSVQVLADYNVLETRVPPSVPLFPMPQQREGSVALIDGALQKEYFSEVKRDLLRSYRNVLDAHIKKYIAAFNKALPVPEASRDYPEEYFTHQEKERRIADVKKILEGSQRDQYVGMLRDTSFRYKYLELLNQSISSLDSLSCFRDHEMKEQLLKLIQDKIASRSGAMKEVQDRLNNGSFSAKDYETIQNDFSYYDFTQSFYDRFKLHVLGKVSVMQSLDEIDGMEYELMRFCRNEELGELELINAGAEVLRPESDFNYFSIKLLGADGMAEKQKMNQRSAMLSAVREAAPELVLSERNFALLLSGEKEFDTYFKNIRLQGIRIKPQVLAVFDDRTKKDFDLLLTVDGIREAKRNSIGGLIKYRSVKYSKTGKAELLELAWPDKYDNASVNMSKLSTLLEKLADLAEED